MKRFLACLVCLAAIGSFCLLSAPAESPVMTAADLTMLARHVGGVAAITDGARLSSYDCDGVSGITAGDLTQLARYVGGITDELYVTGLVVSSGDPDDNSSMTVSFADLRR